MPSANADALFVTLVTPMMSAGVATAPSARFSASLLRSSVNPASQLSPFASERDSRVSCVNSVLASLVA